MFRNTNSYLSSSIGSQVWQRSHRASDIWREQLQM